MARPLEIELWSRAGVRLADITSLCQNVSYTEERNEAETLQFSLDLDTFENYLINEAGLDPVSNFREGQTEIKVKENGQYSFGTQLYYAPINLNNDDQGSATISVQAVGYLNFLASRYPDPDAVYDDIESVEIFYDLIDDAQAVVNGSYGLITRPSGYYVTGVPRDRSFDMYTSSIKANLQYLTNLVDGKFDFRILADKRVMTRQPDGNIRSDFKLAFDRTNFRSTIDNAVLNRGANNLYNQIHGLGSGFGPDQLVSTVDDLPSQIEFGLRELPAQFNEVVNQSTLDENAQAYLNRYKKLLRMPQITLSGADIPAQRIEISDIIPVRMTGRRLIEDMTGMYRVERKEVSYDKNLFIKSMTLYFEKVGEYDGV